MKALKWVLLVLGSVLLLLIAVVAFVGSDWFADRTMCGNDVSARVRSPSKRLEAVTYERSCGATTGFVTMVEVRQASDRVPVGAGNAFAGVWPDSVAHPPHAMVQVRWISEDSAVVTYDPRADVEQHAGKANGVHLQYERGAP